MPISTVSWTLVYGVHFLSKHLSHTRTVDEKNNFLNLYINCNSLYSLYISVTMDQKFRHLYIYTEISNINETIYSSSTHIKTAFELLRLVTTRFGNQWCLLYNSWEYRHTAKLFPHPCTSTQCSKVKATLVAPPAERKLWFHQPRSKLPFHVRIK